MTREEAISEWTFRSNHIKKWLEEYGEEPSIRHYVELIDMAIESLSAETVQGEWIGVTNGRGGHECSNCHAYAPSYMSGAEHLSDYCPNCGARMKPYKGGDDE